MTEFPTPGQLVRLARRSPLILGPSRVLQPGALGVIAGLAGEMRDVYQVSFSPREVYLSSVCVPDGGLAVEVPRSQLTPAGKDDWLSCFRWDRWGKGRQMLRFKNLVRVWNWSPAQKED